MHVAAVDAGGSALFGEKGGNRLVPGRGSAICSALLFGGVAGQDRVIGCRRLAGVEAVSAGGSSGVVVSAVVRNLAEAGDGARRVLLLPDRGERHPDTIHSDPWVFERFGDVQHLWKEQTEATARA